MDLRIQITPTPPPPNPPQPHSAVHFILFNERGLRAGWRLLIFAAVLIPLVAVALTVYGLFLRWLHGPNFQGALTSPLWMGLGELATFCSVALAAWIMGRIEHRPAGVYGLPLETSALSRFLIGYVLWGFLPLTVVLTLMRFLGVLPGDSCFLWLVSLRSIPSAAIRFSHFRTASDSGPPPSSWPFYSAGSTWAMAGKATLEL
jgi:hypothetical protein